VDFLMDNIDIIIIGGGPAGLTAGLYLSRAKINTVLFEKNVIGGQVLLTDRIENYPGYSEGINGYELIKNIYNQAINFGLKIFNEEIINIDLNKEHQGYFVKTNSNIYKSLGLIIASGSKPKKLNIISEEKYIGKGISYCATCDGPFFKDKKVAVVGGGNTAVEEALFLTKFAKEVFVIHRRSQLRATKILQERLFLNKKIVFLNSTIIVDIYGENKVESLKIKNLISNKEEILIVDGIFICIGFEPETNIFRNLIELDEQGYIITNENMETSAVGIFACGDCRRKSFRQIVTACADGANAAFSAEKYLERLKGIEYK